jgi:hypothetical protein
MRYLILSVALWAATFVPVWADSAKIHITIESQITAFKKDDLETAFSFASPNIKRLFGSPERFGMMVRQGYPMVYRPVDIQFLELETIRDEFWQKVRITDKQGRYHIMAYRMILVSEQWLINGVQLLPSEETGV